jgi:2-polyprenyl-6-methoxyphenol hydroxylase-like FAD-dependent oxidoreductase
LADVKLASAMQGDVVSLFMAKKWLRGVLPDARGKSIQDSSQFARWLETKEDLNIEDVLPELQSITKAGVEIEQVNWFTIYKLHHRMAEKFSDGRCFLIGDAAHIHSPVGGQGMNTGLQDAYNLGWKLAAVVNGQIKQTILASYAIERMPVAKELLGTTDRIFNVISSRSWFNGLLKRYIVPNALKLIWKSEKLRGYLLQAGIANRHQLSR